MPEENEESNYQPAGQNSNVVTNSGPSYTLTELAALIAMNRENRVEDNSSTVAIKALDMLRENQARQDLIFERLLQILSGGLQFFAAILPAAKEPEQEEKKDEK